MMRPWRWLYPLLLLLLFGTRLAGAAELSVFAASSLTDALREVAASYQAEHPEDKISLNFAGSQTLATQLEQGAPADLFISANRVAMNRVQQQGLVAAPKNLLQNRLALAIRADLHPPVDNLREVARRDLLLAVGNRHVPIGRYSRQLLAALAADPAFGPQLIARIERNIVSEENRVKAIVAKLQLGEVDAGILYQSDLHSAAAEKFTSVPLPAEHNPQAVYPLAQVRGAQPQTETFSAFLFSPAAQQIFRRYGFTPGAEQ